MFVLLENMICRTFSLSYTSFWLL